MPAAVKERALSLEVDGESVSALLDRPADAKALLVLAHGAGAGMRHRFMASVAAGLAERGIATLRFQFPYLEAGRKRPDAPARAVAAIRAAVAGASRLVPDLPLFSGGKSYGGRMSSTAASEAPLAGVRGIVFFGFPLHAPGKESAARAEHLGAVSVPMLFLQGTRDRLAEIGLVTDVADRLDNAEIAVFDDADHSFHVPKSSGRTDGEVMAAMLDRVADWIGQTIAA